MNKQKLLIIFLSFLCVVMISVAGYTEWKMNKNTERPVKGLTESPINEQEPFLEVIITTDKTHYNIGQTVRIMMINKSTQKTYAWFGPCSLTLQLHNGNTWETSPISWSGCLSGPDCGIQREIPEPRFLNPETTEEIKWNQIVAWCEGGTIIKEGPAVGRFRFVFRYAEDELGCRSTPDLFMCWLSYRNKKWHSAYSNEFTIREHGDLSP